MGMTMLSNIEILAVVVGGIAGCYLLAAFGWSIAFPEHRVDPFVVEDAQIRIRVFQDNLDHPIKTEIVSQKASVD